MEVFSEDTVSPDPSTDQAINYPETGAASGAARQNRQAASTAAAGAARRRLETRTSMDRHGESELKQTADAGCVIAKYISQPSVLVADIQQFLDAAD